MSSFVKEAKLHSGDYGEEEEDADQEESFSLNLGIGIVEIAHENEQKWLIYDKKDHKYVCTFSMEPYHFISNYNTKYTDDMATGSNDTTAFNDSCVNLSLFDARFERKNPHWSQNISKWINYKFTNNSNYVSVLIPNQLIPLNDTVPNDMFATEYKTGVYERWLRRIKTKCSSAYKISTSVYQSI